MKKRYPSTKMPLLWIECNVRNIYNLPCEHCVLLRGFGEGGEVASGLQAAKVALE